MTSLDLQTSPPASGFDSTKSAALNGLCRLVLRMAVLLLWLAIQLTLTAQASRNDDRQASGGNFDGPAELPRKYLKSSLADTPAPGRLRVVKESENLQQAINDAKCGDTLELQVGATFRGVFRFPKKPCDDVHWIVVRSSAADEDLPPENTIITPCYAGVASLPGRPDFHCSSVRNVMAKLELDRNRDSGPVLFADGANHYRLIGLEITRGMPNFHMRNLVQPENPEDTAHHLVFDRLWLHGTTQDETKGGIHLSGTTDVAIVDSFFTDFHCIALHGSCTDAQAINGGGGDHPGGPYKIVNNFLEASGESIMFGGAPGSTTPSDIEIRHNHLFRPILWKLGQPDFVGAADGSPFIVKNCLELKNAQRVLFEGNILENTWGGFSQAGFAIVLTPANQGGLCPQCRVTDVTLRYNKIVHAGGAMLIGNVVGKSQAPSSGGERYSIHDLVFDDIDGVTYKGFGSLALINSVAPPLNSVHFDHITAFPPRVLITIQNTSDKLKDFSFTNSIFTVGDRGMFGAGGGPLNCTHAALDPSAILKSCFADAVFKNNLIIGGSVAWPPGNILVKNASAAGLRDFRQGRGGDYRLCQKKGDGPDCKSPSPALGAAADGKDTGADLEALQKATAGII
jgi:hypothetical protein